MRTNKLAIDIFYIMFTINFIIDIYTQKFSIQNHKRFYIIYLIYFEIKK